MNVVEHLMERGDKLLDKTLFLNASKIGYLLREPTWAPSETWVSMQDKVCVVTGGNSGLGRVVSTRLAGLGARVYLLCRDEERGRRARFEIMNSTQNLDVFLELVDVGANSTALFTIYARVSSAANTHRTTPGRGTSFGTTTTSSASGLPPWQRAPRSRL